ncbi:MAG: chemotaxis protein CheW [Thermodesulfobacteriota bacterium]
MDKMPGEEDFKGLEEEIDDAVDRLFVENKRGGAKTFSTQSPLLEPSLSPPTPQPSMKSPTREPSVKPPDLEPFMQPSTLKPSMESTISELSMKPPVSEPSMKTSLLEPSHEFELEKTFNLDSSSHPPPASVPFSKSVENMEAQLLSLEWEITEEKLKKTREEVLALREVSKQRADMTSLLNYMEEVLSHMIENEENIRPPWIKFLLDSKETLKLLMRKETEGEINIYKQLAHLGIEARFSSLEGLKDPKVFHPSPGKAKGVEEAEIPAPREKKIEDIPVGGKKIEDMSIKMNLFMEKAEEIFRTMKQQIAKIEETTRKAPARSMEPISKPISVTIFKVDKKLFGVESEKVFKLFKVPTTFLEKFASQQKIRLRDLEVKIVDLKKIFSISGGESPGETRILTVKDNGEYKGLLVGQVLRKSSVLLEKREGVGEYFLGLIHSTYQEQPVEIPILDLKKF